MWKILCVLFCAICLAMPGAGCSVQGQYSVRTGLTSAGGGCQTTADLSVDEEADGKALLLTTSNVEHKCGGGSVQKSPQSSAYIILTVDSYQLYLQPGAPEDRNLLRFLSSLVTVHVTPQRTNVTSCEGNCHVTYQYYDENTLVVTKNKCILHGEPLPPEVSITRTSHYTSQDDQLKRISSQDFIETYLLAPTESHKWPSIVQVKGYIEMNKIGDGRVKRGDVSKLVDRILAEGFVETDVQIEDELTTTDSKWLDSVLSPADSQPSNDEDSAEWMLAAAENVFRNVPEDVDVNNVDVNQAGDIMWQLGRHGSAVALSSALALLGRHDAAPHATNRYLAGLATNKEPHSSVIEAVLSGEQWGPRGAVAAARGVRGVAGGAGRQGALVKRLARERRKSKDPEAILTYLEALSTLDTPEAEEELVRAAEEGVGGMALTSVTCPHKVDRLIRAALTPRTARPIEERFFALDAALASRNRSMFAELATVIRHAPPALRKLYWAHVNALPDKEQLLKEIPLKYKSWDVRAIDDKSEWLSIQSTSTDLNISLTSSVCLVSGGLRAGKVSISLGNGGNRGDGGIGELVLGARAGGLGEWASGGDKGGVGDDEGETVKDLWAELRLGGVAADMQPVKLFSSQAELLGVIWSGAGSSWTPVWSGQDGTKSHWRAAVLGRYLRGGTRAGALGQLQARGGASLWARAAGGGASLKVAASAKVAVLMKGIKIKASLTAIPTLTIEAHLDFYDVPKLCLLLQTDEYTMRTNTTIEYSNARLRKHHHNKVISVEGRCLSLGAALSRVCAESPAPPQHL